MIQSYTYHCGQLSVPSHLVMIQRRLFPALVLKPSSIRTIFSVFLGLCSLVSSYSKANEALPIVSLAHVAFQVSDLEKSSRYYQKQFGFESAFSSDNGEQAEYLKVSDEQFIKLVEVDGTTDDNRLVEVAILVNDIQASWTTIKKLGLKPSDIYTAADGTSAINIIDPDGHRIVFVEYGPRSMQAKVRGKYLGLKRSSTRMQHVGITVKNEAEANVFYGEKLGFKETWRASRIDGGRDAWVGMELPGTSGNYIEYILVEGMELTRNQLGSMHHVCLLTDDIHITHKQLLENGLPDVDQYIPRVGRSNRWLINTRDPDGTRTEFMEEELAEPIN